MHAAFVIFNCPRMCPLDLLTVLKLRILRTLVEGIFRDAHVVLKTMLNSSHAHLLLGYLSMDTA